MAKKRNRTRVSSKLDEIPEDLRLKVDVMLADTSNTYEYMGKNDDAPDGLQMAVQLAQTVKATASSGKYKSVIKRKFRMGKGAY